MTKPREPGSIDEAMAMIAGQVDGAWKAMADHVGYEKRTVQGWGDADDQRDIPLRVAIALDQLYLEHGGLIRPLFSVHDRLTRQADAKRYADRLDLIRHTAELATENGEAVEALLVASLPDADDDDRLAAKKEVLDSIRKMEGALQLLDTTEPAEQSRAPP